MATATRAFVAGFLAAMRMYETRNMKESSTRNQIKMAKGKSSSLPPANDKALEIYLAVPTFIRQGRAIGE